MGSLWKGQNPEAFASTPSFIDLDMVGEDPAKTGGTMRIEKMPDPSARYKYRLDTLPGTTRRRADTVRPSARLAHAVGRRRSWSSGPIPATSSTTRTSMRPIWSRPSRRSSTWSAPTRGRVAATTTRSSGTRTTAASTTPSRPCSHGTSPTTSTTPPMDTMDKVSAREMRDVGLTTIGVGYLVANADDDQPTRSSTSSRPRHTSASAWEEDNTTAHLLWALVHPYGEPATTDAALHEAYAGTGNSSTRSIGESQLLSEWGAWYEEAVISARTIFDPADSTPAYHAHETPRSPRWPPTPPMPRRTPPICSPSSTSAPTRSPSTTVPRGATRPTSIWGSPPPASLPAASPACASPTTARPGRRVHRVRRQQRLHPARRRRREDVFAQFQDSEGNISDAVSATIKLDTTGPDPPSAACLRAG